jgi:hypothetical protein
MKFVVIHPLAKTKIIPLERNVNTFLIIVRYNPPILIVIWKTSMEARYEAPALDTTPLFNPGEIHTILTNNLGLRLSSKANELTEGGFGDAVPLSHLGGAHDCIAFITLSAILLNDPELDSDLRTFHLKTLTRIFQNYGGQDLENPNLNCIPTLILVYAVLVGICSAMLSQQQLEYRLPKTEEDVLIGLSVLKNQTLFPDRVFDRSSDYYNDLPSLRLHLTSSFNYLLNHRLQYNCVHYTKETMYYQLLMDNTQPYLKKYATGYDFSHYPLGKAGKTNFERQTIVNHLTIQTDTPLATIKTWLKQACTHLPTKSVANNTVPQPQTYLQQGADWVQKNKVHTAGLVGFCLFGGYKLWKYTQEQSAEEYSPPSLDY